MARRALPARAGRMRWMWITIATLLLVPAVAGAASWRPMLVASAGGTFAVDPDAMGGGGASASLGALWPVTDRVSFGVVVHGDDAGTEVDSLRDASGAGLSYGSIEKRHRAAWGVSWRLDASAPPRFGLTPTISGTWGAYRVGDDAQGRDLRHVGSTGWSLGAGLRREIGPHLALGGYVRYHRLFNDLEGRFMSAGLECFWR